MLQMSRPILCIGPWDEVDKIHEHRDDINFVDRNDRCRQSSDFM